MRLYHLTSEYEAILSEIDELDGELPPDLAERLDAVVEAIEVKAERCVVVIAEADAEAEKFAREVKRLQGRVQKARQLGEFLRYYLLRVLHLQGRKSMECGAFKIRAQASPPRVIVDDMSIVPICFDKRQERTLDLTELKSVLSHGGVVPGVHLEQGEHLRIV